MADKKLDVLVVDDDSLIRELLSAILRNGDFTIAGEASNGEDAYLLCRKLQPSVVLLDINMPRMDGLQVLASIRRVSPQTKVIMVSSEATLGRVKEALAGGASGFIVKPFNSGRVLNDIKASLALIS